MSTLFSSMKVNVSSMFVAGPTCGFTNLNSADTYAASPLTVTLPNITPGNPIYFMLQAPASNGVIQFGANVVTNQFYFQLDLWKMSTTSTITGNWSVINALSNPTNNTSTASPNYQVPPSNYKWIHFNPTLTSDTYTVYARCISTSGYGSCLMNGIRLIAWQKGL